MRCKREIVNCPGDNNMLEYTTGNPDNDIIEKTKAVCHLLLDLDATNIPKIISKTQYPKYESGIQSRADASTSLEAEVLDLAIIIMRLPSNMNPLVI